MSTRLANPRYILLWTSGLLLLLFAPGAVQDAAAACRRCLEVSSCSNARSGGCYCLVTCGPEGCTCSITSPCSNNVCSPGEAPAQGCESSAPEAMQPAAIRWWGGEVAGRMGDEIGGTSPTFGLLVGGLARSLRQSPVFARSVLLTGASGKAGRDEHSPSVDWNLKITGGPDESIWVFEANSTLEDDHSGANRLELRVRRGVASWTLSEDSATRGSGELRSETIAEQAKPPLRQTQPAPR